MRRGVYVQMRMLNAGRPLLLVAGLSALLAQSTAQFEVASVKVPPVVSGAPYDINLGAIQHDTVTLANVSLADCVSFAYGLTSDSQLVGPDWIKSKELRYDIVAKTAPGTTREQALQMMQALLAERFKLALHREQRVLAYYALVVAKGGSKLPDAKDARASAPTGVQGQLRIVSNRMPMSTVATLLSRYMRAFVVDQTGLPGDFEVRLVWTPDDRPIPDDERGPSVFRAVEEQLGLKLVSHKGPMEVLVIDRAEKVPLGN
jgi:uncharacterized protein (TIGR03435 family)